MRDSDERTVFAFELTDGEEVRATVSRFRGQVYVSVRSYWRDSLGEWHPTRKGVTIAAPRLAELEAAVGALRAAVDQPDGA